MENNLQKTSFVMYGSFIDAAMGLNDEQFREYILALKDYALGGIEYESQNPAIQGLLVMAMPQLEAAAKRREKKAKNGQYGILGGRPRKGETAAEYKARKEAIGLSTNSQKPKDNSKKTQNTLEGFQTKTLDGDVDVDRYVEEDVDVDRDAYVDGNVGVDKEAYRNEECGINKDANATRENINVFYNSTGLSSTLSGWATRPESNSQDMGNVIDLENLEDDTNADDFDEQTSNLIGTISDIKEAIRLQEQHPEDASCITSTSQKKNPSIFELSKERKTALMLATKRRIDATKDAILEEEEHYCDRACAILEDNMAVVRNCLECLFKVIIGKTRPALDKISDLIMLQKPKDEEEYRETLIDLCKFYVRDRAYWTEREERGEDSYNPYRSIYQE